MLYQQQVNPQMAPGWGRARSAGRGRGRLLPNWHQGGMGPGATPLLLQEFRLGLDRQPKGSRWGAPPLRMVVWQL